MGFQKSIFYTEDENESEKLKDFLLFVLNRWQFLGIIIVYVVNNSD
jgi:hypothetical protein